MSQENGETGGDRPNEYILKRDFMGSVRLNYNHWMMKDLSGGHLLNPSIPIPSDGPFRVADIGTGTGIWANELATEIGPNGHVTGFDISSEQFPPAISRPENTDYIVHDCFKPFAPEYIGQFDIVHVRFLLCIVNDPVAEPLMRNIATLLKPGGYLEWFEPLAYEVSIVKPDPSLPSPAMDAMKQMWHKPQATSSYHWVDDMPKTFAAFSPPLKTIKVDRLSFKPHHRLPWIYSAFMGLSELVANKTSLPEEKVKEMQAWLVQLQEEAAKGLLFDIPWQSVVVQKA